MTSTLTAVAIVASVLQPVYALAADEPFIGPLARAAIQRAVVETVPAPPSEFHPDAHSRHSNWSQVTRLHPGREIILTGGGVERARRYLLRADESGLVVLNVSGASISDGLANTLVKAAELHPAYFLQARDGASFRSDPAPRWYAAIPVQLSPVGVAVGDQHLADLDQIVQNVTRQDIKELSVEKMHFWQHGVRGTAIGALGGALVGGIPAVNCQPGSEYCDVPELAAAGAAMGGAYGLVIGTFIGAVAPRSPGVIYRVARPK